MLRCYNVSAMAACYLQAGRDEAARELGPKGSDAHKAAVVGDTVGDVSTPACSSAIMLYSLWGLLRSASNVGRRTVLCFAPHAASQAKADTKLSGIDVVAITDAARGVCCWPQGSTTFRLLCLVLVGTGAGAFSCHACWLRGARRCCLSLHEVDPLRQVHAALLQPLKDTSGPSLNILIKLMAVESLVFAPFFKTHTPDGLIFQ